MNVVIDPALTDRVAQLLAEIERTEAARPPVDQEVQTELLRLETVAARAEAAPAMSWLSLRPEFSTAAFAESLTAALLAIEPDKVRKLTADRARRRAEAWTGLRMTQIEKERKLTKLQADLKTARARLEQARRAVEERTLEMQPRTSPIDSPEIWLLPPQQLDQLAAGDNGKRQR